MINMLNYSFTHIYFFILKLVYNFLHKNFYGRVNFEFFRLYYQLFI